MSEVKDFFLAEEIQDSCESDDQAQFWQISVQQFALVWLIFFSYENKFPPCCQIQITLILLKVQGMLTVRSDNKTEVVRSLKIENVLTLTCRNLEL